MIMEMIRRGFFGMSFSAIITFVALTIITFNNLEVLASELWVHMLGSLTLGVFWGMASLLFDTDHLSPMRQIVTHFSLSIIVFYPIALGIGWIPFKMIAIVVSLITFVIIYIVFWFSIHFYLRKMAASLNHAIKQ